MMRGAGLFIQPSTIAAGASPLPRRGPRPAAMRDGRRAVQALGIGAPASWSSSPSASSRRACRPAARARPGVEPQRPAAVLGAQAVDRRLHRARARSAVRARPPRRPTASVSRAIRGRRLVAYLLLRRRWPRPEAGSAHDRACFGRFGAARSRLGACPWPAARAGCPASHRVAAPASARAGMRSRRSCSASLAVVDLLGRDRRRCTARWARTTTRSASSTCRP